MIKIVICEDDKNDRTELKEKLNLIMKSNYLETMIFEYEDGNEFLKASLEKIASIDLIFMDIYMGTANGVDVVKELRNQGIHIPIIFLTASSEFLLESYDVAALFYIVKPIKDEKLSLAIKRFLSTYHSKQILIGSEIISTEDIVFAESILKNINIYLRNGNFINIREKLDNLEKNLIGDNFLRCHQSYIVNLDYVKKIEKDIFFTVIEKAVLIRKRDAASIRKKYYDYLKLISGIGDNL